MSIKTFKPTTPSRRHMTVSGFDGIDKHAKPESGLTEVLKKSAGRNSYGRITVRHRAAARSASIVSSTSSVTRRICPPLSCVWSTIQPQRQHRSGAV